MPAQSSKPREWQTAIHFFGVYMYLALLPDAKSVEYLKWVSPVLPDDVHVTIIHSKQDKPSYLPIYLSNLPLIVPCECFDVFGFKTKAKVLKLRVTPELLFTRQCAEGTLQEKGIRWSADWSFSPHITLGPANGQYKDQFPPTLRFDHMEWR